MIHIIIVIERKRLYEEVLVLGFISYSCELSESYSAIVYSPKYTNKFKKQKEMK